MTNSYNEKVLNNKNTTSTKEELESLVNNSNLKETYKKYYLKKIQKGKITDINVLKKEIEEDEKKNEMLTILKNSDLEEYFKNEIREKIIKNEFSDYKALRKKIKEGENNKRNRKKALEEEKKRKPLILKVGKMNLDEFTEQVVKKEINEGKIDNEETLYERIRELNNPSKVKYKNKSPKTDLPSQNNLNRERYSEDSDYWKDILS